MDIFIEYMVRKKKMVQDYLLMLLISFGGMMIVSLIFILLMGLMPQLSSITLLIVVGLGYLIYRLITSFNVEYEYSLVNSEIDVDKIINVRKRKRLTTVNIKGLEAFGQKKDRHEFESYMKNTSVDKIYACRDKTDDELYYAVYLENDRQKMILFNPNEKMVDRIKKLNPYKTMQI